MFSKSYKLCPTHFPILCVWIWAPDLILSALDICLQRTTHIHFSSGILKLFSFCLWLFYIKLYLPHYIFLLMTLLTSVTSILLYMCFCSQNTNPKRIGLPEFLLTTILNIFASNKTWPISCFHGIRYSHNTRVKKEGAYEPFH